MMSVSVIAFAVSDSTRAGTSASPDASRDVGFHSNSRTAGRYRSVVIILIVEPSISTRTPVSTGKVSSRPAAVTTWVTARANTSLGTVPEAVGMSGSAEYSSMGKVRSVNRDVPQLSSAIAPSTLTSTGWFGRLRAMSTTNRPDTKQRPVSATCAGTVTRTDVS